MFQCPVSRNRKLEVPGLDLADSATYQALGISAWYGYHRSVLKRALNPCSRPISSGLEVTVRTVHHPPLRITAVTLTAIAVAFPCWLYLSKSSPDDKTVSSAADEVYEAVVREMVTPTHRQAKISQLVFDDRVLTELTFGADRKFCEESVRKVLRLENSTPPYNSLVDKMYRVLTGGWWNTGLLRADTIQDFLGKSCTEGHLSRTFHTDFPRTFVDHDSVEFDIVPNQNNVRKDFRQTFLGAGGILALSRVGFDSSLQEAIVSSEFVCGMLCGQGRRHILRKTRGKWEVVQSLVVWIS
jgi:hypothetical protein